MREKFVGGLRLPGDETGDCFMFTEALARARGQARRRLPLRRRPSSGLVADGDRITGVETERGVVTADAYVVALGSYSPLLLKPDRHRPAGLSGQGLLDHRADHRRRRRAANRRVMDETYKVAITRLGDRIRVGGMAEIVGYDRACTPRRRATLEHSSTDLFPGGGDLAAGDLLVRACGR